MMFRIFACVVTFATLVVWQPSVGAEQIDNPAYQLWARFKPGSAAITTMQFASGDKAADATGITVEGTSTLLEVTAAKVTIQTHTSTQMAGHKTESNHEQVFLAKIEKPKGSVIKEVGKEEVEVGGKKYKCQITEETTPAAGGSTTKVKLWTCDKVPGGMVKMETTIDTGGDASTIRARLVSSTAK